MRFQYILRLFYFITILIAFNAVAATASPHIFIGDFNDNSGQPASEFKEFLSIALTKAGFLCCNSSAANQDARYSLSGLVEKKKKGTSYSALLTDNYSLEPDVFFNGKQIGGSNASPAASKLSKSIEKLLANQDITSIEVIGDSRLTPNAVMALAQVKPGETASPQKIIAGRIILENCGLFEEVQLYLTPGTEGRALKIIVKERVMVIANSIPGPGKAMLDNILGPPVHYLPQFPISPNLSRPFLGNSTSNSTGNATTVNMDQLAHEAEKALAKLEINDSQYEPEDLENLIAVASAIKDNLYSYDDSCRSMCIILLKLCSVLDSKTMRNLTYHLQNEMNQASGAESMEKTLAQIEFFNHAYKAAAETQTILTSRLYAETPHSPIIPWILFSLGEQALKAEDIKRSAPLLKAATSVSSLPVSPEMLLLTAQAQYSNLDHKSGDSASALLRPLLAEPTLNQNVQKRIKRMSHWADLCEIATAITDKDGFEQQLKKGDALILLDRPDLAEPLFHRLHEEYPDDARPFTGFGRLAFQRTGNLYSARPYIERGSKLPHRDRFFYELALAYTLKRITGEALPTINIEGRDSEEASATRFLLPKAFAYADSYKQFNKSQALLISAGIEVLDDWLSYTAMKSADACEIMFTQTASLLDENPDSQVIRSANYFFSTFSKDRDSARKLLAMPLNNKMGLEPRLLQLNLLIKEMHAMPTQELANATESAVIAIATDAENRSKVVALQADALAIVGLYRKSKDNLLKAKSLYDLAIDLSNGQKKGRILNNQACVYLALGKKSEADDLYDEALDNSPHFPQAVVLGNTVSSFPQKELELELSNYIEKTTSEELKMAAQSIIGISDSSNSTEGELINSGLLHVLLEEVPHTDADYNNIEGLQLNFSYESNPWLLPAKTLIN
ncbi:BamA/TamA family outer membrane protein [Maridesulfovibrio frigidus]|uniref:cyclic nucleotide-binding protein n=1 Tax=Maridesulfovibrio frigidus TaxID=340956 RepID=UPI0004E21587|nr:cyclic nucleotide-binding protein [Maridesulfovibrio frigidus]